MFLTLLTSDELPQKLEIDGIKYFVASDALTKLGRPIHPSNQNRFLRRELPKDCFVPPHVLTKQSLITEYGFWLLIHKIDTEITRSIRERIYKNTYNLYLERWDIDYTCHIERKMYKEKADALQQELNTTKELLEATKLESESKLKHLIDEYRKEFEPAKTTIETLTIAKQQHEQEVAKLKQQYGHEISKLKQQLHTVTKVKVFVDDIRHLVDSANPSQLKDILKTKLDFFKP